MAFPNGYPDNDRWFHLTAAFISARNVPAHIRPLAGWRDHQVWGAGCCKICSTLRLSAQAYCIWRHASRSTRSYKRTFQNTLLMSALWSWHTVEAGTTRPSDQSGHQVKAETMLWSRSSPWLHWVKLEAMCIGSCKLCWDDLASPDYIVYCWRFICQKNKMWCIAWLYRYTYTMQSLMYVHVWLYIQRER